VKAKTEKIRTPQVTRNEQRDRCQLVAAKVYARRAAFWCRKSMTALSTDFVHWWDYAKAESLYQRALKIREKPLGPEQRSATDTIPHARA
jgi:hypothetical protein